MPEHVYKVVEIVGSSEESVSKAIDRAIAKAATTLRNIIAERVLGLPTDIRVDKNRPFSEVPTGRRQ